MGRRREPASNGTGNWARAARERLRGRVSRRAAARTERHACAQSWRTGAERADRGARCGHGVWSEAFLSWNGDRYEVLASEGGHSDFAPSDEVQVGLWRHLAAKFGHVSWERVVSGMGIANIYEYMSSAGTFAECPAVRDAIKAGGDVAPVVSAHALNANDPLCTAVMDVFVRAYGAEAGNLALKLVARGGVYLAGGIATKIMPLLTDGRFRTAYCEKGRFRTLVESIPAYVVTHPRVGVLGAAVAACAK